MAENLILACYLLFSGCIVVALLNVYWQELVHFPHFVYDCIRGWFKIDTPSEREWSLIKASVISALFIAGYLWWLNTHSTFVSLFPGTLVITVIAIPVAWILWIWRNQDKLRTLKNTEKEFARNEKDRLLDDFFKFQQVADDKTVSENLRITALYCLEQYLKLDEKTRFPDLTKDFLFNLLQGAKEDYQGRLNRFLWGMILFGTDVRDVVEARRSRVITELLYSKGIDSNYIFRKQSILYPELDICNREFINRYFSFVWLPFCSCSEIKFEGEWKNGDFSLGKFSDCEFVPKSKFSSGKFIEVGFESVTAIEATFSSCNFLYATWSGIFQKCIFQNVLFVGIQRANFSDALMFQENEFNDCLFINSADLLASIVNGQRLNEYTRIDILQFPAAFIQKYEEIIKTERLNPYLSMHIQIWTRYLYSPHEKNIIIPDSATDLYHEYKTQRENMGIEEKQGYPLPLTKLYMVSNLFDDLLGFYERQLPFLKELLETAYHFEKTGEFDWQILHNAFNDKKAELEPESVTSPAE